MNSIPLSERIRPDVEAAPWVIEEVRKLEAQLAARVPAAVKESVESLVDSLGGMKQLVEDVLNGDDRPTLHDVFDYITESGPAIDCNCPRCADWKARFAAGAGAVAPVEAARLLKRSFEALELVMDEPVGDGIQVKQRIGAELAYGIEYTIRELKAATDEACRALPVRDIHLPDGSVRHNVGSDNLSDEDREAMVLTDEQVAALNEDERRNGAYGTAPTPPASGPHPSHTTRISMDASSYDEICTKCSATDIAGGGWGRLAQPCPVAVKVDSPVQPVEWRCNESIHGRPRCESQCPICEGDENDIEAEREHTAGAGESQQAAPESSAGAGSGEIADSEQATPSGESAEGMGNTPRSIDRPAAAVDALVQRADAPAEPATETAKPQSGVMAALIDNLRNSGPKWTFGTPPNRQKKG